MRRRAFTLFEILIALALFSILIGLLAWLLGFGGRSTGRLTSSLALHQATRRATARFLADIQEGMEVISPRPGNTAAYTVIRDKISVLRWYYQVPSQTDPTLSDLRVSIKDDTLPAAQQDALVISNVRRLTFSTRTEGALQINLELATEGQDYPLLTTVRLRNIASAEELW